MIISRETYLEAVNPSLMLALERNKRYGSSIDIARDDTLIDLCLMKLMRTRELPVNDTKRLDEIQDVINYLIFIEMRRLQK